MTSQNRTTPQDRMIQIADNARVMSNREGFEASTVLRDILMSLNDLVSYEEAAILLADREEGWYTRLVGATSAALRTIDPNLKDASACAAFYLSGVLQWKVDNPNYSDCDGIIQHFFRVTQAHHVLNKAEARVNQPKQ